MAGRQRNGVDAAIALLVALAESNGEAKAAALRQRIGAPRASFHRIVRTLAAAGIVEAPRGSLRVGPLAEALIAANAAACRREDGRLAPKRSGSGRRPAVARSAEAAQSGLVPLSRPAVTRRSGRFRIGFSNASMNNLWRVALVHGVEYAAAHLDDSIEQLTVLHAEDDARRQ